VFGDGIEQAVLVAEQPVDHGCLHACRLRHPAGGQRRRSLLLQQTRRDVDDLRPGVGPATDLRLSAHVPTISEKWYRRFSSDTVVVIPLIPREFRA
jgi:hypothetical protein